MSPLWLEAGGSLYELGGCGREGDTTVKMRLLLFLLFTVVTFATVYSQFFGYPYYGYGYGMYPGMMSP
ncbi:hypothetical protein NECAME_16932 [Necator americanus]|uniref:Uncharacterized protein n=1 Tax=Necator americanus TaxID=51031 RepID=W2TSL8_NECAM|nr:hypothetical protein NECAME_16932 [Necator americanus]ETN85075.1 hypothetical protein NECAME_16932 [Necator americanus]